MWVRLDSYDEPQGSTCLCLLSPEVPTVSSHAWLVMWGLAWELRSSCVYGRHSIGRAITPSLNPTLYLLRMLSQRVVLDDRGRDCGEEGLHLGFATH